MLRNYFKTALRNLTRHKLFAILNVLGLSTGLACSMLIWLWVYHELSYDRFHVHSADIYRITATTLDQPFAVAGAPLAGALRAQIPGVVDAGRLKATYGESTIVTVGEKRFEEKDAYFADPNILRMFSFPLVAGDPATALVAPDGLLLTERMAKKYFGAADPIGKTIRVGDKDLFRVTGILKDIPDNSHLQFGILMPMSHDSLTDDDVRLQHWANLNFITYVQLNPHKTTAIPDLEKRITDLYNSGDSTFRLHIGLQPLTRIHLYSKYLFDLEGMGDIRYVRIFSFVALIVLLVACINFMNLATARSARRAKEVGVRKVIGARRGNLIGQFLSESVLITLLSLALGLVLVWLCLPAFSEALGKTLTVHLGDGWLFAGLLGVFLLTGLVSGSYPALFLSSFRPIKVLKTTVARVGGVNLFFRNGLVVFQFVVSIVLIVGTIVVYSQLRYIQNKNLGFDKANLLYMPLKGEISKHMDALTAQLQSSPHLGSYTVVSEIPVNLGMGTAGVHWPGKRPDTHPMFSVMGVDTSTIGVFRFKMAAGRNFSSSYLTDTLNYIVNESALKVLGLDVHSAIGKPLQVWDNKGVIIGVVKDFNFKPVQSAVDPLIMRYNPGPRTDWLRGMLVVNTTPAGVGAAIADLQTLSARLNPTYDFEYGFVDQRLAAQYQSEQRLGFLFNVFAVLAIFISCLGLGGLAAFTAEQRTKEIGIRKVLGASVGGIVALLSRGFLRLVLISIALATPLAYYCMHRWLQDYAFRIHLSVWFFVVAGVTAVLIALATVSAQAIKAAISNPVKSLRTE
jgi:ABC-type antimicrobial peptide transport system permease subunit